jgi:hypothetical protein
VDYLIKKDGVLDKVGYMETTSDFPIYIDLAGEEGIKIIQLSDQMLMNSFLRDF